MPQLLFPRRLAFRGAIEVRAWGFSRSLFSLDELRRRVLSLWQSGARLEEFEWGFVLHLPAPQKMRAESAPATPLVWSKNRLAAAPIEARDELSEGVWIIENGEWHALQNGHLVDVSSWLDAGIWSAPATATLGTVPEVPLVLAPVTLDLRSEIGIKAPDQKWQTIWERKSKTAGFSPSQWFERLSDLLTPHREVSDVPLASNLSIVWSALLVIGGALLFCLFAFGSSTGGRGIPAGEIVAILLVVAFVLLARRRLPLRPPSHSGSSVAPPLVVSKGVQSVALGLVAIGVLRMALVDLDGAMRTLFFVFLVWALSRLSGFFGRLSGRTAVGVGSASASKTGRESWLARWLRAHPTGGTSGNKTRDNISDAWRRLLARAAMQSGLFKQLGRAQARYLMRSMELFERGDLEAALRHAIALGGQGNGAWSPPPALRVPNARGDLNLSLANLPASGSMNFGPEIEAKLRALYRGAFEKLRDAGDWQKAAFVLADLLRNAEEAVAFLEEQGQFELAARLAEGRELAPGLVVRAWWLAGNRERAVQIARLKSAFADAVLRLERDPKNRDEALALRLLWGHHLASQGRFAAAVEAVWSIESGRPLAQKWLRLGLEHHLSPQLLARALSLEPQSWGEWRPLLDELLGDDHPEEGARNRETFALQLVARKGETNPALAVAARQTARRLLQDGASGRGGLDKSAWENLLALANDGLLRADSKWPAPKVKASALVEGGPPLELRIQGDGGTLQARDAVLLESGELLVALGESGARLLSRDGRVKAHFDVPAHQIVRAFDAPRALLVARRDEVTRVSSLDLVTRKTKFWGDVRATCFAHCFDGATWFVGSEGRVRALDVAAPSPAALWDSGDLNGEARELAINRTSLAALVEHRVPANSLASIGRGAVSRDSFESWRFELPALVLRARLTPKEFPDFGENSAAPIQRRIGANAAQFAVAAATLEDGSLRLFWLWDGHKVPIGDNPQSLFGVVASGGHALILWHDEEGVLASVLHRPSDKIIARLRFEGATFLGARECDGVWLLWDDAGRVVAWNPTTGHREKQWSVS